MAMSAKELGELVIKITADSQDAEAAMARIQRAVDQTSAGGKGSLYDLEKAASKVGVGFTSLGRLSTRIGSTITTKVTAPLIAAGAGAARTAINFLELKEKTKVSFETMLGSAEKAKQMISDLYEFSKTTPFSQETFYTAAQSLLAMGFSAKETKDNLAAFTNAAIATGRGQEGINTLTRAFGKMNAAGKVSLEGLNMITDMGVPAIDILANAYNVNKEELFKMIRQGEVLSEEALPKLVKGMQEGTDGVNGMTAAYGQLAEKMKSGTITGALDSLHSAWRNFALAVFDADTDEKQEEKVKKIVELLNQAKRVLNNLAPVFGSVTENTNSFLDTITELTKKLADFLETADKDKLKGIGDAIIGIAKAGPMFLMLGGALKVIGSSFRAVSGIAKIASEFSKLPDVFGGIGEKTKNVNSKLIMFAQTLTNKLPVASQIASRGMGPIAPTLGGVATALAPLIPLIVAVTSVLVWLKRNWEMVTSVVSNFAEKIEIDEKLGRVEEAFSNLAKAMGGEGGDIFQSLGDIFEVIGGVIMTILVPAFTLLAGLISGFLNLVAGFVNALSGVVKFISGFLEVLAGLFTLDFSKVEDGFTKMGDGIKQTFDGLGEAIVGAFAGILDGVGNFIISLIEEFTGIDIGTFEDVGGNIGEGLLVGLGENLSDFGDWANDLWDSIVQGICDLFGINSPAENMKPYGRYIGEGIREGWNDFIGSASEWPGKLWSSIVSGFGTIAGKAVEAGGNLASNIKSGVEKGKSWLQTAGGKLGTAVRNGVQGAKGLVQKAGSLIGGAAQKGVQGTKSLLSSAGKLIGGAAKKGLEGTKGLLSSAGKAIGGAARKGVEGTKGLLNAAGRAIGGAAQKGAAAMSGLMAAVGKRFGSMLGSGIKGMTGTVASGARSLATNAKSAISSAWAGARSWGSHLGSNIASGLRGAIGACKSAAGAVASAIAGALKHTVPKEGPLKDEMTWMPHMVDNLTSTMRKSSPKLVQAASDMASELRDTMYMDDVSLHGDVTSNLNVGAGSDLGAMMQQMLAIMMEMAGRPDPNYQIVLETGVVAGAMTSHIDRNLGTLNRRRSKGL